MAHKEERQAEKQINPASCVQILETPEWITPTAVKVTLVLDATASQSRLCNELSKLPSQIGAPYRDIDGRIFEAIERVNAGASFRKASIQVFGTPHRAEAIRYWQNRLGGRR